MNTSLSSSSSSGDSSMPSGRCSLFDLPTLLHSSGVQATVSSYEASDIIFSQGDPADAVMHIQRGIIKKSVMSHSGKEAVVAVLGPGEFFGEECLVGQPTRKATASAMTASRVLTVDKRAMLDMMHRHPALADRFLSHALTRLIRTEEDLLDQLFNPGEKRLARALVLLARDGKAVQQQRKKSTARS
jgi:CRP/FNR family transcriptional regulator, cyclic AMP receptor protein